MSNPNYMSDLSSENIFKPNYVAIEDPIINAESKKIFAVVKGGVQTTEREFISSTFSNSSCQFSTPPPSPLIFTSRRVLLKVPVQITFTTVEQGLTGPAILSNYDAFRQAPLASIMQSIDVVINGQSITLNMNDIIKPLLIYHNSQRDLSERELSTSPLLRDQAQTYDMLCPSDGQTSNRNPLTVFINAPPGALNGRGSFPYDSVATSTNANQQQVTVLNATLTEEIFLSPLLFGGVRDEGFIGIQSFEMNINWDSNLQLIWSRCADHPQGNVFIDVSLTANNPSLLFRYVTPPRNLSIPRYLQYNYNEIQRYPTEKGASIDANGGVTQLTTNNVQLNAIPRFIYLFAREPNSNRTATTCDCYYSIKKVRVNWNNQNALLANASQQQLYDISRKNGFDGSWTEWSGQPMYYMNPGGETKTIQGIGSVLCLEFGTDIALNEDECPGLIGTYNIQIEVDVANYSANVVTPALYMITIIPGIFTIYDNSASKRIGVLSRRDVENAKKVDGIGYYSMQKNLMSGGFKFKRFARQAYKVGKKISPSLKKYLPAKYHALFDMSERALDQLYKVFLHKEPNSGESKEQKIQEILPKIKGKSKAQIKQELSGSAYVGGMLMSSADLNRTLQSLGI